MSPKSQRRRSWRRRRPPILFNRFNVLSYESARRSNKFAAMINWTIGGWGATLRATRYGEVLSPDPNPALDFTLSPKTAGGR